MNPLPLKIGFNKSNDKPSVGMFVSLHNTFPPTHMNHMGVIVSIKKEPLGFNYGVHEYGENKLYFHHISTIIPLDII